MAEIHADEILPPGAGPSSRQIALLDGAIVTAFPTFGPLLKDADNTYLKTSYLPLDTLLDDIRQPLFQQGVLITSCFQLVRGGFVVTTTLSHSGGGWRSSSFPVGDPSNPQKVASSATYGLRINLCQLLALVGRDDDGNAGAQPQQMPPQQYAPPPQQQPAPQYAPPQQQQPTQPPPLDGSHSNVLPANAWQPPGAQWTPPPTAPNPAQSPYV